MAKKRKGMMVALRDFFRWTIWGLAAIFAVALYLNWTKDSEAPGSSEIAVLPNPEPAAESESAEGAADPELPDTETNAAVDEATETAENAVEMAAEQATESTENAVEMAAEQATGVVNETAETAGEVMTGASESVGQAAAALAKISIPGSDGTYNLLNAFRRDDGTLEFTIEQKESTGSTFEIRRMTCAPLAVATVASGASTEALGDRNDAAELKRIPLGSAESLVAAAICGAFR